MYTLGFEKPCGGWGWGGVGVGCVFKACGVEENGIVKGWWAN